MPRQRKTATQTEVQPDTSNTTERKIKMPMTAEQIRAVYAKRRTKGLYSELLATFVDSGEPGVSVREEWPTQFSWDASQPEGERGKVASTLKQGFENAKDKKDAPDSFALVDVIVDDTEVYLLNRAILDSSVTGEPEAEEAA